METTFTMNGDQHAELRRHLFPGDGKEAAAIVLCGRRAGSKRHRLLARKVHPIFFEVCETRSETEVTWSTDTIVPVLEEADRDGLSVVKIHSHPDGFSEFSALDDRSDKDLFPCIAEWCEKDVPHASAVMLPDGRIFGRVVHADGTFEPLAQIAVIGDDWEFWRPCEFTKAPAPALPAFAKRHAQAFGERTTRAFQELSIAVIGCSGTGSPTIAQLAHIGVKRLVLVDPDRVHDLNLNRILYATAEDAKAKRLKVDVVGDAIKRMGLGTEVVKVPCNLCTREAVHAVAECDVIFGCVDSAEGRFLANLIANFYVIPYVDAGVTIETEEDSGEISQVCGYVHCLTPGGSSLLSRQAITLEDVRADGMKRQNPAFYEEQRRAGYIKGVEEDRPAVISVNMQFAAAAVNELISRLHSYREKPNRYYAKIGLSLMEVDYYPEAEGPSCAYMSKQLGKGDVNPPLHLAELSERTPS